MYTATLILGWIAIITGSAAIILYVIGFVCALVCAFMDD